MKKKTDKKNKIRKIWSECLDYVGESKNYILFATIIFLLLVIAGLFFPTPQILADKINELLKQLVEQTSRLGTWPLIAFILKNNAFVSLLGLFLGALLGIVPFIIALSNGYVLGYVLKIVMANGGADQLWKIFPHGIFELPAILISLGLGLRLGMSMFSKNPGKEFLRRLWLSVKVFLLVIIPLLIIAAIIEGSLIKLLG